ncbi:VanW family protein [Patescibacteria group bacterium]|nr:VanW family protein [Patescibacteria group bacterium]
MIAKKKIKVLFNPWFFVFGIIFAVIIVVLWRFVQYDNTYLNRIYPNVYIDGKNFSGATKNEVIKYFIDKSTLLQKSYFTVFLDTQPVATFSGQLLNLSYDGQTAAERAYRIGRSTFPLSALYQRVSALLNRSRYDFISNINFDDTVVREKIEALKDQVDEPAKNALFKFENGKVVSFRKEENGREISEDSVIADFDNSVQSLKKNPGSKEIIIKPIILKPEITLSSINSYGIEELIAVGQSNYSHSIPGRIHNVILAASKFNGVLIPPGKVFSFNDTVGDISALTGYEQAYIIKEGKTVLGDGGGVCQVSTTLFRAALNAGLPIVERTAHAYRVSYYENDMGPGYDATVFAPSVDLKIKNDTPAYILIETEVDQENNLLYFKLYGKKDNRRVEISKSTVWDVVPAPDPKYQDDPTLKKGVVKQVDFAASGAKAMFEYKVYKGSGLTIDQKFYSNYQPWQAVYLVGTAD